jgi:hypothetical protein
MRGVDAGPAARSSATGENLIRCSRIRAAATGSGAFASAFAGSVRCPSQVREGRGELPQVLATSPPWLCQERLRFGLTVSVADPYPWPRVPQPPMPEAPCGRRASPPWSPLAPLGLERLELDATFKAQR